ncbi:ABC transporter permease [Alicyclobacillus sp. ALC3]|uniref:ABC transporter permease n=1 Tax=Alicyclobacillus sp. ALC3 TaxID=2796143 RepID=UPI00237875D6|nr:ABC transporter permease [Alicyclobacillus sp. ALC3]WDL98429.1 ABC transporter permease [Alicyclobacillus sp. ALC3]
MTRYLINRAALMVFTIWGVVTITFVIGFLIPANPARTIAGVHATAARVAQIAHLYGFDQPFYLRYLHFLWNLLHLNVGMSYHYHESAMLIVLQRLPATLYLGVFAVLTELIIGFPLGVYLAYKRDTWVDSVLSAMFVGGASMPTYWFGIILIYVVAYKANLLPIGGFNGYGPAGWSSLVLPALTYGITGAAYYARILRSTLSDVLEQDYVRTAHAKGLQRFRITRKHVIRAGLLPFVTQLGMDIAYTLSGLIILEQVFDWPGIGNLVVTGIDYVDVPIIIATTIVTATLVVVLNFLVDLSYMWLDPRLRHDH